MDSANSEALLPETYESNNDNDNQETEGKRMALQREQLSRRPSYRKILDEISETVPTSQPSPPSPPSSQTDQNKSKLQQQTIITVPQGQSTQLITGPHGGGTIPAMFQSTPVIVTSDVMNALAITLTNSNNNAQSAVLALPSQNPVNSVPTEHLNQPTTIMSFGASQAEQLQGISAQVLSNVSGVTQNPRTTLITTPYPYIQGLHRSPTNPQVVMAQGMTSAGNHQTPQQLADEATKKREIRLMKNREAARHCRVKKKEYVKCLEERVQILESQNKKLIEELKSLQEFYKSSHVTIGLTPKKEYTGPE